MKKKNVRLLIISLITAFILVVVLCTTTLMRLKDISVEYESTRIYLTDNSSDLIVEASGFNYNENLLFTKMDKYINNIEKYVPYAKVINIERKFQNKAIIHVAERTPVARVRNSTFLGQFTVYDKELKVLNVSNEMNLNKSVGEDKLPIIRFDNTYQHEIDLSVTSGQFLHDEILRYYIASIADGTYEYNQMSTTIMSDIIIGKSGGYTIFTISFNNSDITANIVGENDLEDKIYNVIKVFSESSGVYSGYNIGVTYDGIVYQQNN